MGLTNAAMGVKAVDSGLIIKKQSPADLVVALAGNPNVGKSTVFNSLTGLNQHTGNWPGKTVTNAQGYCAGKNHSYVMVDIPGTYSLMAHSAEEEVARNFICFGEPDAVVVVCDATCLERNLNLVLQTLEISQKTIVCVNLMDEAKRKHIKIDLSEISRWLGVPVVGAIARKKKTLTPLLQAMDAMADRTTNAIQEPPVRYPEPVEQAILAIQPVLEPMLAGRINSRWLS
ncbi:MAG: FeoB small GTPase domain-containing protein, partial [Eubacteriales bacterium]|nr:FeoB small GTPase domain-containing protein [Eubacteriales bacterium]